MTTLKISDYIKCILVFSGNVNGPRKVGGNLDSRGTLILKNIKVFIIEQLFITTAPALYYSFKSQYGGNKVLCGSLHPLRAFLVYYWTDGRIRFKLCLKSSVCVLRNVSTNTMDSQKR